MSDSPPPDSPLRPAHMSTLEGVGSLLVIGGVLVGLGTFPSPQLASTLLPLAGLGCVVGILVIWVARLLMRTR